MNARERTNTLSPGDMLNWYRIEGILGRGGFGVTYLALDTNLDHRVAIKEYLPDQIARRDSDNSVRPVTAEEQPAFQWGLYRFITEARTLVKFKHPNIVRVLSVFEGNQTAYMVMEFEQGQDLKHLLQHPGSNDERFLKKIIVPIIDGLQEVHRHGFIHRDIKPANIYVRENQTPVLLDFGAARQALGARAQQMTAMVSVGYAPLEQYDDSCDSQQGPWTDIYALGAVLYYAIAGNPPVESTLRASAFLNDQADPYTSVSDVTTHSNGPGNGQGYSQGFLSAIDWALGFKVADRPKSLDEWSAALLSDSQSTNTMQKSGSAFRPNKSRWKLTSHRKGQWWNIAGRRRGQWRKVSSRRTGWWQRVAGGLVILVIGVLGYQLISIDPGRPDKPGPPDTIQIDNTQNTQPVTPQSPSTYEALNLMATDPEPESKQQVDVTDTPIRTDIESRTSAVNVQPEAEIIRTPQISVPRPQSEIQKILPEKKPVATEPDPSQGLNQRLPISQSDLQLVSSRFQALRRAIEEKDQAKIDQITVASSSKNSFFSFVFSNFTTIEVSITSLRTQPAGQSIFAHLQIGHMIRGNGDRVTPAEDYRSIPLRSERRGNQWSPIIW